MGFRAAIDNILAELNTNQTAISIRGNSKDRILAGVSLIRQQFELLEADVDVCATEEDVRKIREMLDTCKGVVLTYPITEVSSTLIKNICILAHNWNENTTKHEGISVDCKFINDAVDGHFTLRDLVSVAKKLIRTAGGTSTYTSIAKDISTHFLEAIDAIHKEKDNG